jgi:D-alanyl-D-alanine dipeptidase
MTRIDDDKTINHLTLLNKLIQIPVIDNGEKLVSIRKSCPELVMEICQLGEQNANRETMLRKTVANMLTKAQMLLPDGYRFKIWEAHRPIEKQEFMRKKYLEQLIAANPKKPKDKLERERDMYVARLDIIPPHLTGGAVDLTIIGPNQKEMDMGTGYLDFSEETHTHAPNINWLAKGNRKLLLEAMEGSGFVNYSYEWWHWSYGDRYWAYMMNKDKSIYGPI